MKPESFGVPRQIEAVVKGLADIGPLGDGSQIKDGKAGIGDHQR